MEKLVLIDGNSLLNRAFYATPAFTTKNGLPTNGVFGFIKLLLKIISDKNPTHMAVAFDLRAPTFRHKMYADYKAGRRPMPDDLAKQFPVLKDLLKMMQICVCEMEGYEADDLIGTIAKKFSLQTYVYTGDRDSYQLVDDSTSVCFTRKGVSDILELTSKNFKDEIGLVPSQIIDLKALMGDKSDNIPGVAGVGEKSGMGLLERFSDVDGIYAHLDEVTGALHKKLAEGKEQAYFSRELATIDVHAPYEIELGECVLRMPFSAAVKEKFAELEFKSLLTKDIFAEKLPEFASYGAENAETETTTETEDMSVSEIVPLTIAEAIDYVRAADSDLIAAYFDEKELRVFIPTKTDGAVLTECVCPIKNGLLDVGFFEYQLEPLLREIYEGDETVIAYNAKDVMHRLTAFGVQHKAAYDDVSILKCLADGAGNTDELPFCLQYYNLPEKHKAYGLFRLCALYKAKLRNTEMKLYQEIELPLVRVLYDMEQVGVAVDLPTLKELSVKYNEEIKQTLAKIYELAGKEFNVNSTKQLGEVLFEKLKIGVGTKKRKASNSYKTTAEELEKYASEHEIVRYVLRYRKIQKINSTYIEGFKPLIVDGRVHTTYNQSYTQTGRLSSANPNLQNIPIRTAEGRELRKVFTASEDNVLVDADYSQIELRLLAHFSGCKELVQAYCENKDIHAITASQVFGVPLDEVTPQLRREAKAVNFGIIYGISAFGLGNDLNIAPKQAKAYIDKYFETYSDVQKYMHANVENASRDGFVETLCGRRRVMNELKSSNFNVRSFGERAAMNMPLQGSSADIIKIAMINVHKKLREEGLQAKLVLQVHDEVVIDAPKSEEGRVREILQTEMENAVKLSVPLIAEVGVGRTWFDAK